MNLILRYSYRGLVLRIEFLRYSVRGIIGLATIYRFNYMQLNYSRFKRGLYMRIGGAIS
jgi:hypothetical protein